MEQAQTGDYMKVGVWGGGGLWDDATINVAPVDTVSKSVWDKAMAGQSVQFDSCHKPTKL